jgi:hypothetical protein
MQSAKQAIFYSCSVKSDGSIFCQSIFSLLSLFGSLLRYTDSKGLEVVIKVGKRIDDMNLPIGGFALGGLFFYGHDPQSPNRLWLRGDCQRDSQSYEYR